MKKQLVIFSTILILIGLNLSCKKEKDNEYIPPELLIATKFDLNDANILVIMNKSENFRNLYKLTSNDSLVNVNLLTTDNEIITDNNHDFEVSQIIPLNENFVLLRGSFYIISSDPSKRFEAHKLLVNINTGVFYECDLMGINFLQKENQNNGSIFYSKEGSNIVKVDISNPTGIIKETYISDVDQNSFFEFDHQNNMIYGTVQNFGILSGIKVKTAEGNIISLNEYNPNEENFKFWKSPEGHFRIMSRDQVTGKISIYEFSYAVSSFIKVELLELNNSNYDYSTLKYSLNSPLNSGGKTFFLNEFSNNNFVYNEPANTFETISLPVAINYRKYFGVNDFIYTHDGSSFYKIDPLSETYSHIFPTGTYELKEMESYNNNQLLISALRNTNGKYIFAKIDEQNNMTILKESLDQYANSIVYIHDN